MVILSVVILVLSLVVIIRNRSPDDELLASIGVVGGLAVLITALSGMRNEKPE